MLEQLLNAWNWLSLTVGDAVVGWLLALHSDLALVLFALILSATMAVIRRLTSNQDLLGRIAHDTRTLKGLMRQDKQKGDKEALARRKVTLAQLDLLKLKAELRPLAFSLLPLALLGTWAALRLGCHPPRAGETIAVAACLPVSAEGDIIHIVPVEGLEALNGWVQQVAAVKNHDGAARGEATWRLRGAANAKPYPLRFRFKDRSFERPLIVGQHVYAAPLDDAFAGADGAPLRTELRMRERKLFGIVPGCGDALPPWVVACVLIALPCFLAWKRVLRTH
jgi:hypothetical protein